VNIKLETQQKKLKTVRGPYTGLDLTIHAKKGSIKSRDTLPLNSSGATLESASFESTSTCRYAKTLVGKIKSMQINILKQNF
jgi:hypothetical protein